ncbi:Lipase_GDSL domain-containing protein [Cephalotus follicularis]|uniref:Lipase_GDSL domain-containing protein n=1 Tax=Cephalotus follicularis TaxID=3775 RepID=A0A1Q3BY09_CEPFO|nr:Lipase_GDSL domain-containing protein [Cephalotus follicularis]
MAHHHFLKNLFFFFLLTHLNIFSFNLSKAQMVPAVYVFGDSLVDVGNNNYLPISITKADFPHNGIDFPNRIPTGRFSNGKNTADFLAEKVGLPTSPPYLSRILGNNEGSFLTGVNFASGGAGIFNGTDEKYQQSIPLTQQVEYYSMVHEELIQQMGYSDVQNHSSKSLFVIVIGSNDIFDYFGSSDLRKKSNPQQYVDLMAITLQGPIKQLYNTGARKFVVAGLAQIGCSPTQRVKNQTGKCNEEINYWSRKYNQGLKTIMQDLKSELNGMSYSYFDTFSVMQNAIQNPASYGLTEIKSACCGLGTLMAMVPCLPIATYCSNRGDHLFWDPYHPTEATARFFVDAIFDGPLNYTSPMNVRQLIAV